jgi:hypothetical protein
MSGLNRDGIENISRSNFSIFPIQSSEANVIKLFFDLIAALNKLANLFFLVKTFQSSLIFGSRAGANPSRAHFNFGAVNVSL